MSDQAKISVLIPAYNCGQYLKTCLDSICNQSYKLIEILICDDASTDNTWQIIQQFDDNRIKAIRNQSNLGNLRTMNALFEMATGDFIALQDADDWSDKDRLKIQIEHLLAHPELSACYPQMKKVNVDNEVLFNSHYPIKYEEIKKAMPYYFKMVCAGILFKKSVLQEIGNYPNYFSSTGGADWYWTYLFFEKFKAENLDNIHYYYLSNPSSISNSHTENYRKFYISEIIIFLIKQRKKHGKDGLTDENLKKDLEDYEQRLKLKFETDTLIHLKRDYVNARLEGNKELRKSIFNDMMYTSKIKTISWFLIKPISMLLNKVRISLS